jgi:AraC-like DNA-binding protein
MSQLVSGCSGGIPLLDMGTKSFRTILHGPGFSLGTWSCTHAHREPGEEQWSPCTTINVVLDGVFVRHVGRTALQVDPTVAVLSAPGEAWRTSHPGRTCGDKGVWVLLDEAHFVCPAGDRTRALPGRSWLDWAQLAREAEVELAAALIEELLHGPELPAREPWYVARARRVLTDRLLDPPDLTELAAEIHVSPWHLCRIFRAATGLTPRAYVERLRLAHAARRIARGCPDLGELALELGFSSHSHLTARYRAVFGAPPRARS